jgi:uncharacterized protein with von Willebrand factor type A (vWA) domain
MKKRGRSHELTEQNREIFIKILKGKTYQDVADEYEVTKQRIEQVFRRMLKFIREYRREEFDSLGIGERHRIELIRMKSNRLIEIVDDMPIGRYERSGS